MGLLRLILALSVVFSHSVGAVFVGGRNAVQLFYMISGFLISYVLLESGKYKNTGGFYASRYLRLAPSYIFMLLVVIIFQYGFFLSNADILKEFYGRLPTDATALLVLSNISIFFQDWIMFLTVDHDSLMFTPNFQLDKTKLYKGLLIPQGWSLGVEITFYIVAPFILRKPKIIFCLLFFSVALRFFFIAGGIGLIDPWSYRFFPTELALFLFGAASHRYILPFYKKRFAQNIDGVSAVWTLVFLVLCLVYALIPIDKLVKSLILFLLFFFILPFTFIFQVKYPIDRWFGELSYPIYVNHIFCIWLTHTYLNFLNDWGAGKMAILSALISIIFGILMVIFIERPIERYRKSLSET